MPRYLLDSRQFDRIRERVGSPGFAFKATISAFLPFPSRTSRSRARFIACTWEISGLAACNAWLIKVYGWIVECKQSCVPAGGNFIYTSPEGTRAITLSFATDCKSPLFDTVQCAALALSTVLPSFSSFFFSFSLFAFESLTLGVVSNRPLVVRFFDRACIQYQTRFMEYN